MLVIQGDAFNRSNINAVICAVITTNQHYASSPANLLLEKADSKLPVTSVVNFSQIVTVDKSYLKHDNLNADIGGIIPALSFSLLIGFLLILVYWVT